MAMKPDPMLDQSIHALESLGFGGALNAVAALLTSEDATGTKRQEGDWMERAWTHHAGKSVGHTVAAITGGTVDETPHQHAVRAATRALMALGTLAKGGA